MHWIQLYTFGGVSWPAGELCSVLFGPTVVSWRFSCELGVVAGSLVSPKESLFRVAVIVIGVLFFLPVAKQGPLSPCWQHRGWFEWNGVTLH
jgi:hypothetical protein